VNNRGDPIAPAFLPGIFEPFRLDVPYDRSPHGLGLGLYIVQQIVLAHRGEIHVESNAQEGTTSTMRLPRAGPETRPTRMLAPQGDSFAHGLRSL
jgi:signal transduction histidine kinase